MTKGLITDGVIPQVEIAAQTLSLHAIPAEHRTRFFNRGELDTLAHLLKGKKRILEIGCQNGRTAKAILSNDDEIEIYVGIDVPPGTQLACGVQQRETPALAGQLAFDDDRFFCIVSKDGSAFARRLLPEFDAVFIDGDHSHAAVLRDHALAESLVKKGGVIIHHDYHSLGTVGVREALRDLHNAGVPLKHVAGTWLVFCEV